MRIIRSIGSLSLVLGMLAISAASFAQVRGGVAFTIGKVTLRGPVRSEEEKTNIEAKAVAVAGEGNVTDQLEIAPPK